MPPGTGSGSGRGRLRDGQRLPDADHHRTRAQMYGKATSLLYPHSLYGRAPTRSGSDLLVLKMRYDDGFVAYLNGDGDRPGVLHRHAGVEFGRQPRITPMRTPLIFEPFDVIAA